MTKHIFHNNRGFNLNFFRLEWDAEKREEVEIFCGEIKTRKIVVCRFWLKNLVSSLKRACHSFYLRLEPQDSFLSLQLDPILIKKLSIEWLLKFYFYSSLSAFLQIDFQMHHVNTYECFWWELEEPVELTNNIFVHA